MVNMYGAGKAFNLRYVRNSQIPSNALRRPNCGYRQPVDMHHYCSQQTNINVQVGPPKFWGGFLGFLTGMGGFGGIASLIGMLNSRQAGPVAGQQPAQQQGPSLADQQLANLRTLYPNLKFVKNPDDNTFTASNEKNQTIISRATFDEITKFLEASNANKEDGNQKVNDEDDKVGNDDDGNTPVGNSEDGNGTKTDVKWDDVTQMTCRDDSGKTANISGKFAIVDKGDGENPKTITITDTSSGSAHKYTFELVGTKDGKPIYKCKDMNDHAVRDNEYTLVRDANGQPELVQLSGQKNHSLGLGLNTGGSTPANKPGNTNNQKLENDKSASEQENSKVEDKTTHEPPKNSKNNNRKGYEAADLMMQVNWTSQDTNKAQALIKGIDVKNGDSMASFITGYNEKKSNTMTGDSIVAQIRGEAQINPPDQQKCIQHVIKQLKAEAQALGVDTTEFDKTVSDIGGKYMVYPNQADKLDKAINDLSAKINEQYNNQ